ncbi:MAG: c-type cytochrome biogenesis protein CcmI [Candidatus Dactylopiibacterium carminicum]|uniref:C-type cytochrome biogenesis protein CcmI n=1 Tax=Candidatus Dactylopiibacterium carminicum TaxID=857335 RepID=A0A272EYV2_9RHOO|nr:c-type cytochrome biogenesis protein CcmI [Candidatus Dactylopiibacterium carminicum]KAF7600181.1 c-type cytochrome biogenesis protein CcmI [Candidatus Dactylopiibacterium carminicum]PAS94800.1 MAG: c-type cytochrome biogenesis protein CcmI [Candidatus Dactylopiibacterium carminicum]PAT00182.1 MAG: c-type cytochrome biogenesis protein CcmI [Candidatus Dactylopiibacterium carminicum]
MSLFVMLAVLLLACLLVVLLRPLLRPAETTEGTALPTLAVLREQRRELEAERDAGRLDAAGFEEAMRELEQRVLDEMPDTATTPGAARATRGWRIALAAGLPLTAVAVYLLLGNPAALDPAHRAPLTPQSQLAAMITTLEARVQQMPDDSEAAAMLARAYMLQGRHAEAAQRFAALAEKRPQDAQLRADWADALASAQGNRVAGEPEQRAQEALALEADNIKALALAGTGAFEREDYKAAIALWQRLAARVTPGSEMAASVQTMLDQAHLRAGDAQGAQAGPMPQGRLSLAPALRDRVQPEDVVFVVLRPAGGGMPVAALRYKAGELPLQFDFAQAARMGGTEHGALQLVARISRSGDATPRAGDLESAPVSLQGQTGPVTLQIDRVRE